ncbi:MAG: hypothetical protein JJV95_03475 [Sulfurospirillum sp.]|nr:hypothetical protein [Sulfurospirillum sp.]MBL0703028.1 hypothetical protein [Sulfurospirillum sp.]
MSHDFVMVIGTTLSYDNPTLLNEIKKSNIALLSVMEDIGLMDSIKLFTKYEVGSEEGVVAILAKEFLKDIDLPKEIQNYFNNLDEGYISAETNIGNEEIEELHSMLKNSSNPLIIFGKDIFLSSRIKNISKLINLIKKYSNIKIKCLDELKSNQIASIEKIEELKSFDGTIVFEYNSTKDRDLLIGSAQFAIAAKIQDKQAIVVKNQNREFKLDTRLKGTIALMANETKEDSYRFEVEKIIKREVQ